MLTHRVLNLCSISSMYDGRRSLYCNFGRLIFRRIFCGPSASPLAKESTTNDSGMSHQEISDSKAKKENPTSSSPVEPAQQSKKAEEVREEGTTTGGAGSTTNVFEKLITKFGKLTTGKGKETGKDSRQKLSSLTIEGVAEYIREHKAKNIIVLTGAGISTSAGVPDFRSPGTGLYDNVSQYNLPDPMAIFDIGYFRRHPEPFYKLAKDLFPSNLKPTPCHYLIRLMDEKGVLLRWYTQNIDSLEFVTGINEEKLVTAHGCHHTSTCLACYAKYDLDWIMKKVFVENVEVAYCEKCGGVVKPDIVFFGENLPARFFNCTIEDFPKCDLLIIMGTSLVVHPFAGLVDEVRDDVPRLLINLTEAGRSINSIFAFAASSGLCYADEDNYRDVFWQGKTDDGAWKLAELLGWKEELQKLIKTEYEKIDKKHKEDVKKLAKSAPTTQSSNDAKKPDAKPTEPSKSDDEKTTD